MIVEFDRSFGKSLGKLNDRTLFTKIETLILTLESADSISEISGIKKTCWI